MKLMIVDDEPVIVRGLAKLLDYEKLGFDTVLEVTDSIRALSLITESPPDVLLSDIVMPNYNGLDLLRHLREAGLDTKVIFLSGYQDFTYAQEALSLGAEGYLLKPVEQDKLEELLMKAGRSLSQNREKDALHRKLQNVAEKPSKSDPLAQWVQHGGTPADETILWYCLLGIKTSGAPERGALEESLLQFSMYNKAESYAQAHGGIAFVKEDHLVVVLTGESAEKIQQLAEDMGEGIVAHLQKEYRQPLWYVAGDAFQRMQRIPQMHRMLVSLMETHQAVIPNEQSTIAKVKEHILSHYPENLSLEVMASIACVHPTYFSTYFRKHTGMGFKAYLTQTRIQAAQQLLHSNELKVYEVAERVGFSDPRYFSDTFRKVTGVTPQQYKEQLGHQPE